MVKLTRLILLTAACLPWAALQADEILNQNGISLHSMDEMTEAGGDCGCYFYYPGRPENEAFILYWPFHDGTAVIKVNGKLEKMDILSDDSNDASKYKNQIQFSMKNATTSVSGNCIATWVCPEDSESCEITKYAGTIQIKYMDKEIEVPVEGACGC